MEQPNQTLEKPKKSLNAARPPFFLLITAAVLVVIAIVSAPAINGMPVKDKVNNVLLTGAPFILIFVAIILTFIFFIAMVAARLNDRISPRAYAVVETLILGGIIFGVVGMFQPWTIAGYQVGFHVLLFCLLAFNVWSHITPKRTRRGEGS